MSKYSIDAELYEAAIEELLTSLKRKFPSVANEEYAKDHFAKLWSHVVKFSESHAHLSDFKETERIIPSGLSEQHREELTKIFLETRQKRFDHHEALKKKHFDAHRSGLLSLLTGDLGIIKTTAEKLIDTHILKTG